MTDLEPRLQHLRRTPVPDGPDPAEVRARAGRRKARRPRRVAPATVPIIVLLAVVAATARSTDDGPESVRAADPTTTHTSPTPGTSAPAPADPPPDVVLGALAGVDVEVSPATGLRDGQLVTVRVDGHERIADPIIALCAGDVTTETAAEACDLTPLEPGGASEGAEGLAAEQQVAVRRVIWISREMDEENDQGGDYDCAAEPSGCVLVVGTNGLPASGVGVGVSFAAGELPAASATASPRTGLEDGQVVEIAGSGLRPNTTYAITQCGTTSDAGCDDLTWPSAKSDAVGELVATYPAKAAIYGWKGRTDCTVEDCVIQIRTTGGEPAADVPIRFAAAVVAPVPRISLSPAGPYRDGQEITVSGTGFPPGHDVSSDLGQCPAGKDTAVEERCMYGSLLHGAAVVDERGRFSATFRLGSMFCGGTDGCVLGWVLNHGPTIAAVPVPLA